MEHGQSGPEPGNPQNGYNQPTLYIPIASPPTPVPSPGPNMTHNQYSYMPNLHNHTHLTLSSPNINQATSSTHFCTELALHVLSFVEAPVTLCRAMRVSRRWYAVLRDESMWKTRNVVKERWLRRHLIHQHHLRLPLHRNHFPGEDTSERLL